MSSALNAPYPSSSLARIQRYWSYHKRKHLFKKGRKERREGRKDGRKGGKKKKEKKRKKEGRKEEREGEEGRKEGRNAIGSRKFHSKIYCKEATLTLGVFFRVRINFIICIFINLWVNLLTQICLAQLPQNMPSLCFYFNSDVWLFSLEI